MIARRLIGVVCPSEILAEEMEARGWIAAELAKLIPYSNDEEFNVNLLAIEMYLEVGPTTAAVRLGDLAGKLDLALGLSEGFFARLEQAWLANIVDVPEVESEL